MRDVKLNWSAKYMIEKCDRQSFTHLAE